MSTSALVVGQELALSKLESPISVAELQAQITTLLGPHLKVYRAEDAGALTQAFIGIEVSSLSVEWELEATLEEIDLSAVEEARGAYAQALEPHPKWASQLKRALPGLAVRKPVITLLTLDEERRAAAELLYGMQGYVSMDGGVWSFSLRGDHGFDIPKINAHLATSKFSVEPEEFDKDPEAWVMETAHEVERFLKREVSGEIIGLWGGNATAFDVICGAKLKTLLEGKSALKVNLEVKKSPKMKIRKAGYSYLLESEDQSPLREPRFYHLLEHYG